MEFLKEHWSIIKEFAGIYSITTTWKIDIEQNVLSNFIKIELDNRYSDIKSLFKLGLKRESWINLLQLNYHNKRYRLIHKQYIESLLKDIDSNNGSEHNFCPIFIFMNYVYTNIDDFRHKEWFMIIYHEKVYKLLDFYTDENQGGRYDMLIDLLNDIILIL